MNLLILLVSWLFFLPVGSQDDSVHPTKMVACLEDPNIMNSVSTDMNTNPYYLRGDFDGDGRPDFAVAVKGTKSKRNGVLICLASGVRVILGADNRTTPPFSDMHDDNFVAPNWQVATRSDILAFRKTNRNVSVPKGESILMVWEDGIHYIYWDRTKFRWSPMMQ